MPSRSKSATKAADPAALRREVAGRYVSGDGRFTVEQSSGGWLVEDGAQSNELGLPLVRGPFATLDAAKAAMADARTGPAPASPLAERIATRPPAPRAGRPGRARPAEPEAPPPPPPIVVREYRPRDGDSLRELWAAVDFRSKGDDDAGLRRMAGRNPGLLLVAAQGDTVLGSALGAWDGRRGWIYHVAVAASQRRTGLATRLVRQVEDRLRELGAPKVNVMVRDDNPDGAAFWEAAGYAPAPARQFGRDLDPDAPG